MLQRAELSGSYDALVPADLPGYLKEAGSNST
jgi:hypothetical protein